MKKLITLAAVVAAVSLAGCATTSDVAEVRALAEKAQSSADRAQQTADQAMAAAREASAKADAAQAAAKEVDNKIDQMFKKTMMK